jgi:hypothetical protein
MRGSGRILRGVQRLYSMFPTGWAAFGLVLLRIAVAVPLFGAELNRESPLAPWLAVTFWILSVMVSFGIVTPVASVLTGVVRLFVLPECHTDAAIVMFVTAAALAFVGPGAYSLDRYWFGRRLVVSSGPRRER